MHLNDLSRKVKQKRIADYYDKEAAEYDKNFSSPVCEAEDKIIASLITPHIKGRVIDVGCGTGFFLDHFSPKKYCGLDISEKMIERARTKHPERIFNVGDMNNIPYPKNIFDTLVSLYGPMSYSLKPTNYLPNFREFWFPTER